MTPLPLPLALADELYRHGSTNTPNTVADELVRMHKEIEDLTETLAELWATDRKHASDMAEDELAAFTRAGELLAAKLKETLSRDDATSQKCESRTPGKPRPDRECDDSDCWKIGGCSKLGADNSQAAAPQPQREWVGLTDEDVRELDTSEFWDDHTPADFVRLVENKLREKNGGGV